MEKKTLQFLAGFFLILASPIFSGAQDQIPAPYSPKEGDRWEFTSSIKESAAVAGGSSSTDRLEGDFAAVYEGGGLLFLRMVDGQDYQAGANIADQLADVFSFTNSKMGYFKFPMTAGIEWPISFEYTPRGRKQRASVIGKGKVLGFKEVDIAAGHFKVAEIKIDADQSTPIGNVPMEVKALYSPETGCAVWLYRDTNVGGLGAKVETKLTKHIPGKKQ